MRIYPTSSKLAYQRILNLLWTTFMTLQILSGPTLCSFESGIPLVCKYLTTYFQINTISFPFQIDFCFLFACIYKAPPPLGVREWLLEGVVCAHTCLVSEGQPGTLKCWELRCDGHLTLDWWSLPSFLSACTSLVRHKSHASEFWVYRVSPPTVIASSDLCRLG